MPVDIIPNQPTTSRNTNMNTPPTRSYAARTKTFPKKNQAIVFNVRENTPLENYLYPIGDIVGPANVTHAYKLSNGRFCIWFNKKELVDQIINQNRFITINEDDTIEIRRYVNPAIRVIISNVCASVTDAIIEDAFATLNIKLASHVSDLKSTYGERPDFKHVLGSRRQVYVAPDQQNLIPHSIIITHEETEYRLYLNQPDTLCTNCEQKGHTYIFCPNQNNAPTLTEQKTTPTQMENLLLDIEEATTETPKATPETIPTTSETIPATPETIQTPNSPNPTQNLNNITVSQTDIEDSDVDPFIKPPTKNNPKRSARSSLADDSSIESSREDEMDTGEPKTNKPKGKPKKIRAISPENLPLVTVEDVLSPLKEEIKNNPKTYLFSYPLYLQYLDKAQRTNEQLKLASKFTKNTSGLILALQEIHKNITGRIPRGRITRIINRLKEELKEDNS